MDNVKCKNFSEMKEIALNREKCYTKSTWSSNTRHN